MKKIVLSLLLLPLLNSCTHKDEKKHTDTIFKTPISDIIYPKKGVGYTTMSINVKGYVDDSIYVAFGKDKSWAKFYQSKKIDTIISVDYYGDIPATFYYNPYKAKKGRVEISFSLLGSN